MISKALSYRGKHFTVPEFSDGTPMLITGDPRENEIRVPDDSLILGDLNSVWDLRKFKDEGRRPLSLGKVSSTLFGRQSTPRILDMPIKFPGSEFRVPAGLEQFHSVIKKVADFETTINDCYDEYYCYLTVDQGPLQYGKLQREAPCHVDGFQGEKWKPKHKINHTYVVADCVPTTYYLQPFDFDGLDPAVHNFFWEMNRQVALTNSQHAWQPENYELCMIDAYTVHRGSPSPFPTEAGMKRTWIRLSFETRVFNRLGNARNPLFRYNWKMEQRDIEGLNLVAYDQDCDPTLRVFPWQKPDGTPYEDPKMRTQPNLKPQQV